MSNMDNKREKINIVDSGWVFALAIFLPAVAGWILYYLLGIIVSYVLPFSISDTAYYFIMAFITQLLLLASSFFYSRRNKIDLIKATRLNRKIKGEHAALIVVLAFALLCFNLPIQSVVTEFIEGVGLSTTSSSSLEISDLSGAGSIILAIVLVAVMPAFSEEIIYRGFICNTLAAGSRRIRPKTVIISALLFAVMHQSPGQTIHPFILGSVMAIVFLSTGSLWASIILHFTNNLIVILISTLAPGFETYVVTNWWWVMIVAAAIIVPIVVRFIKEAEPRSDDEILPITLEERNKALPFFVAAVVYCLYIWVYTLLGYA